MGRPLFGQALNTNQPTTPSKRKVPERTRSANPDERSPSDLVECLPCVLYECSTSLQITYISSNSFDLIGLRSPDLLGNRTFWDKIAREDLTAVTDKIAQLHETGTAALIHRIMSDVGLPIWVCHSFRAVNSDATSGIRGCIVPISHERRLQSVEPGVISRFVHKIGNHFQVLSLVISGLKKNLSDSRPADILEGSLEKAVGLTRAFSEFAQASCGMAPVDLAAVLAAVIANKRPFFADKQVALEERLDASIHSVRLLGDGYLLEQAFNNVLQNALEASPAAGCVLVEATVESWRGNGKVARVRFSDRGCGISEERLQQALVPFYTSKNDHEGLGLSSASRFVEMHGGRLTITSAENNGTTVDIMLPATATAPGASLPTQ